MTSAQELDRLGDLVSTIGSDRFGSEFYRLFREVLDIEECTVFSFPADTKPKQLVVEGHGKDDRSLARAIAKEYVAGGYLADPNVRRVWAGSAADIYIVRPDQIPDAEYRRRYYDDPSVSQELVLMGRADQTLYYSSFYKKQPRREFGEVELDRIGALANFVLKTLHRHNKLVGVVEAAMSDGIEESGNESAKERRQRTLAHLRETLIAGPHALSPREAEICAGIVMGYSTLAISLRCGISLNTVATHRKRAYAKLGISSQNELFVRYFATVTRFQAQLAH